jgi:hypothetical protein
VPHIEPAILSEPLVFRQPLSFGAIFAVWYPELPDNLAPETADVIDRNPVQKYNALKVRGCRFEGNERYEIDWKPNHEASEHTLSIDLP